ncbi:MAG: hypothetical protein KDD50_04430 [Bdellovibrionales bacterium]|nr:hypothetical protein [Bdellovibrionales bacterium]
MKKAAVIGTFLIIFQLPISAKADMFGGDVVVLVKILANAIKQLMELNNIVQNGRRQFDSFRQLHAGINNALELINTTFPNAGSKVYEDWKKIDGSIKKYEQIYGIIKNTPNSGILSDIDRTLTEALVLNNNTYNMSHRIDMAGENIKVHSQQVSPKGAAKLTAQSLGIVLQTMNQSLRTQSTQLKIQAQNAAKKNKEDKEETKFILNMSSDLKNKLQNSDFQFNIPRF